MLNKLFNTITNQHEKSWNFHANDFPKYMQERANLFSEPYSNTFSVLIDASLRSVKTLFPKESDCIKNITNTNRNEFPQLITLYFWSYLLFFLKENKEYSRSFIIASEEFMKVRRDDNYEFTEFWQLKDYEKNLIEFINEKEENYKNQTRDYLWSEYVSKIFHNDDFEKNLFYKNFIENYKYYFNYKELLKFIEDDINICESLEFLEKKNKILHVLLLQIMRPSPYDVINENRDKNKVDKVLIGIKYLKENITYHDTFDLYDEKFIFQEELKTLREVVENFNKTHTLTYKPRRFFDETSW